MGNEEITAKSMTGYGRCQKSFDDNDVSVEIRSVNSRYLEFNSRISRNYSFLEDKVRSLVSSRVSRGKVDVYITVIPTGLEDLTVDVNESLAKGYVDAARKLSEMFDLENDFTVNSLCGKGDIFTVRKNEVDEEKAWQEISDVLNGAIDAFIEMRRVEGRKLVCDIIGKSDHILDIVSKIEEKSPETVKNYENRLYSKLGEILDDKNIDEQRILTEAAIFADKVAVDEETVRLRSHISQLKTIIYLDEPIGRKLDFIVQEMNRETNTIGSKANDIEIAQMVIEIKAEIEKIREQIQNIE